MRLRWWHGVCGLLFPVLLLKLVLSRGGLDDGSGARLRVLVLSDLHDSVASVQRLRTWFEHQSLLSSIDVVLCPGDITTQPLDQAWVPAAHFEYMRRARRTLRAIAALGKPIYFVPGNHEPLALFNGSSPHSSVAVDGAHNVHGRTVLVRPGLALGGWGGSSVATEGGVTVWPRYPFDENEASAGSTARDFPCGRACRSRPARPASPPNLPLPPPLLWAAVVVPRLLRARPQVGEGHRRLVSSARAQQSTLLLLSHCGPAGSGTSRVTASVPDEPCAPGVRAQTIEAGSSAMRDVLSSPEAQDWVVAAVHGHSHASGGAARLGSVELFNPGSLRFGQSIGVLDFHRSDGRGLTGRAWELREARRIYLPGGCGEGSGDVPEALGVPLNAERLWPQPNLALPQAAALGACLALAAVGIVRWTCGGRDRQGQRTGEEARHYLVVDSVGI